MASQGPNNTHNAAHVPGQAQGLLPEEFKDQLTYGLGDFYNVESVIKRLAGNGQRGYVDDDLDSAMFDRPKSFAVDYRENVYVADKNNYTIKKITKSSIVKCRAT
ncbi:NHL domain-containing protein [Abeliophyllum distichum]